MRAPAGAGGPRVLVHTDQAYWWADRTLWTGQPFARFVCALADRGCRVTLCGRFVPGAPAGRVPVPPSVGFAALPAGGAAAGPAALRGAPAALRRWWAALEGQDVAWLLGPNVWSVPFALLARARGVPVVLGVRQDLPTYARHRHPERPAVHVAARALDAAFRRLARRRPAVVVGGVLARRYARAREVAEIRVSLVPAAAVAAAPRGDLPAGRPLRALSVGRLDAEKNPLLLADVAAATPAWALEVCGDGPLAGALATRAATLGTADRVTLAGVVAGPTLAGRYAAADALVHVSWTEGVPQVLLEAFAAGLPVVATAVGGAPDAVGDAALLVPPGDAVAVARALERLRTEPGLAAALSARGLEIARRHTLEAETGAVAALLARTARRGAPSLTVPTAAPTAAPAAGPADAPHGSRPPLVR